MSEIIDIDATVEPIEPTQFPRSEAIFAIGTFETLKLGTLGLFPDGSFLARLFDEAGVNYVGKAGSPLLAIEDAFSAFDAGRQVAGDAAMKAVAQAVTDKLGPEPEQSRLILPN